MGLSNLRAYKHLKRRRGVEQTGCPELALAPRGKTKHARRRLEERMPISDFPFSVRTLQEMMRRKELIVEPAGKGCLSLISEEHHFKVVTDRNVRTIITVYKW